MYFGNPARPRESSLGPTRGLYSWSARAGDPAYGPLASSRAVNPRRPRSRLVLGDFAKRRGPRAGRTAGHPVSSACTEPVQLDRPEGSRRSTRLTRPSARDADARRVRRITCVDLVPGRSHRDPGRTRSPSASLAPAAVVDGGLAFGPARTWTEFRAGCGRYRRRRRLRTIRRRPRPHPRPRR